MSELYVHMSKRYHCQHGGYVLFKIEERLTHKFSVVSIVVIHSFRACQEFLDLKDLWVGEECLGNLVPQVYQVEMVAMGKEVSKERGENLDLQELGDFQVLL
jgi:hypothetical protein